MSVEFGIGSVLRLWLSVTIASNLQVCANVEEDLLLRICKLVK